MAWSKANKVIAVAVAILLAAGAASVAVKKVIHRKSDPATNDSLWLVDDEKIEKLPQVFIFRPTHWNLIAGGTRDVIVGEPTAGRFVARGRVLKYYVVAAYDYHGAATNIFLPPDFPATEKYDCMLTISNHPSDTLQRELKKQFGIVARKEFRGEHYALIVEKVE